MQLFSRLGLVDALRMYLEAFCLPGEAQQIDRLVQAFAEACYPLCAGIIYILLYIYFIKPYYLKLFKKRVS